MIGATGSAGKREPLTKKRAAPQSPVYCVQAHATPGCPDWPARHSVEVTGRESEITNPRMLTALQAGERADRYKDVRQDPLELSIASCLALIKPWAAQRPVTLSRYEGQRSFVWPDDTASPCGGQPNLWMRQMDRTQRKVDADFGGPSDNFVQERATADLWRARRT